MNIQIKNIVITALSIVTFITCMPMLAMQYTGPGCCGTYATAFKNRDIRTLRTYKTTNPTYASQIDEDIAFLQEGYDEEEELKQEEEAIKREQERALARKRRQEKLKRQEEEAKRASFAPQNPDLLYN